MSNFKQYKLKQQQQQQQQYHQKKRIHSKEDDDVENKHLATNILKNGIVTFNNSIEMIVGDLINKKLRADQTIPDPFGCRHFACFFRGQSKWWEKGGSWGELYT